MNVCSVHVAASPTTKVANSTCDYFATLLLLFLLLLHQFQPIGQLKHCNRFEKVKQCIFHSVYICRNMQNKNWTCKCKTSYSFSAVIEKRYWCPRSEEHLHTVTSFVRQERLLRLQIANNNWFALFVFILVLFLFILLDRNCGGNAHGMVQLS